jgi:phosphoglucomutase
VRIYTERHSTDEREYGQDSREALRATIEAAQAFSDLKGYTGRESPTVVT